MISFLNKISTTKLYFLFLLTGFLLYGLSLFNGFVADDNIYILENSGIRNFNLPSFFLGSSYYTGDVTQLGGIYYKPLFTLIASILFQLSGGTPFLFHLIQIIFHTGNVLLLFLLFKHFFSKQISIVLSFLFLVHPGNTESVVYISNLQDVLYPFFGLLALNFSFSKIKISGKYLLISLFLLISLLSKETGILFLPTLILLTYLKNKKELSWTTISAISVFLTYLFMRFGIARVTINKQAIAPIMSADFGTRLMTMPKIIFSYLILFFFPKDLSWGHHWVVNSPDFNNFFLPLIIISLLVLGLISATYILFKVKNKHQLLPAWLFFSFITISGIGLHLQFIPLDFTFADRWAYFPFIGFCGILGVIFSTIQFKKFNSTLLLSLIIIILIILSARTFVRTFDWKDDLTLTAHDVTVDTNSFVLENNLAFALIKKSDFNNAWPHLEKSIALYPSQGAFNNLAAVYSHQKDYQKAVELYHQSLTFGDFYMTYQNLIADLIRQKNYSEALSQTEIALKKYPNNPKLWLLLAVVYYDQDKSEEALQAANRANMLTPGIANFVLSKIKSKSPIEF